MALIAVGYFAFRIGRATGRPRESAEERQMRRMQEETNAANAFAELSPAVQTDVDRLLMDKKVIEAIKVIREHTGLGLRDAKLATDHRRKQLAI